MTDTTYTMGSLSGFLQQHGEELSDQEKEIESSSEEEDDEEFEMRLQLALREQVTKADGKAGDWISKYAGENNQQFLEMDLDLDFDI